MEAGSIITVESTGFTFSRYVAGGEPPAEKKIEKFAGGSIFCPFVVYNDRRISGLPGIWTGTSVL